jgi:hypothetical protein
MSVFFIGFCFIDGISNYLFYLLLLVFFGGLWGIGYSGYLFFSDYKNMKRIFKRKFNRFYHILFFIGVFSLFLSYFKIMFSLVAFVFLVFPILFVFLIVVQDNKLKFRINTQELREGDLLLERIIIGKKTIKPNWEGLSRDEALFLNRQNKFVRIKKGIPFVPGFLFSFIAYIFIKVILVLI